MLIISLLVGIMIFFLMVKVIFEVIFEEYVLCCFYNYNLLLQFYLVFFYLSSVFSERKIVKDRNREEKGDYFYEGERF